MINIKADSRKVKPGDTFIALRGISSDGHSYIPMAINNGAKKLVVEEGTYDIPYEIVADTREYLNNYLIENYSYINDMNIIGITGTNGKTTTAYLLYEALNKLGSKSIYIGTIGLYDINGKVSNLPNTSPDICDMYDIIVSYYDKGYKNVILEASSQGLIHDRLKGIKFNYGIFTNLTQDHLDEHKTMENYSNAKRIMFDNLKEDGYSILNSDDSYSNKYITNNSIYYGYNNDDFKIVDAKYKNNGTLFKYSYKGNIYEIETNLIGDYNVYNSLSVIVVLTFMGYSDNSIKDVMKNIYSPSGRLDIINYKNNSIVIDYAHTEDAMEKVINTSKLFTKGKTYVVFGCTGSRDKIKRPLMMKLACSKSDYVIVTIDDPHSEDPNDIVKDMLEGNMNNNYEVILDRAQAIRKGISLLKDNDTLLVLGKGHEEFINYDKVKVPFNDRKEIEKIIASEKVEI